MINQSLLLAGDDAYNLTRSLRFRSSASAYLTRTPASASNRKTWTWSAWVKRGKLGASQRLLAINGGTESTYIEFGFSAGDDLAFGSYNNNFRITNQLFRDPSAWYHIVINLDTTQAVGANRVKMYINGVEVTSFRTVYEPPLNTDYAVNLNALTYIGTSNGSASLLDGYITELNFVDGQALTASSFGETDILTGVWKPKKFGGAYGTNGFYLPFTDVATTSGSNAGLGKDFSGNGNYWNTNNISVTAGTTYDSMNDVPTLTSATTANYAVLNPLDKLLSPTVVDGNLGATVGDNAEIRGTIYVSSGKWYWEVVPTTMTFSFIGIGIGGATKHWGTTGVSYYGANGNKYVNGTASAYGASYTNNDVIGVALDLDNLQITFYKNNTSQGTITGLTAGSYALALSAAGNSSVYAANFGQRPFAYTPPTGFVALNTFNLPEPSIKKGSKNFNAVTYTGTGSTLSITGVGFQPDLVWIKQRSGTQSHCLYDSVRGATKQLNSNNAGSEGTYAGVSSFDADGFTVGTADNNTNGATYIAWCWKAGNSAGSSNTAGSITSTVSANPTAGFSVVTYTGTGANATVGHGLGVVPSMIIIKNRTGAYSWSVYFTGMTVNQYLLLNTTGSTAVFSGQWNTLPTSSVFGLGSGDLGSNQSGASFVAYCFAPVANYSVFNFYTGNGSTDGAFVFTGFRPAYIMIRRTDAANWWQIWDKARNPNNVVNNYLGANASDGEYSATSPNDLIDFTANGFKIRGSNAAINTNGGTYIYMAFAENPFKNSLAR